MTTVSNFFGIEKPIPKIRKQKKLLPFGKVKSY